MMLEDACPVLQRPAEDQRSKVTLFRPTEFQRVLASFNFRQSKLWSHHKGKSVGAVSYYCCM